MYDTTRNSTDGTATAGQKESALEHAWNGNEPFHVTLSEAIESAAGGDVTDHEPLYETIDVESIEELVTNSASDGLYVVFSYEDCFVEVRGDGTIEVTPFYH